VDLRALDQDQVLFTRGEAMTPEVEKAINHFKKRLHLSDTTSLMGNILADAVVRLEKENAELKREIEELRGRIGEFFNDEGLRIQNDKWDEECNTPDLLELPEGIKNQLQKLEKENAESKNTLTEIAKYYSPSR
jgi:regulator of replication initiation timing